MSRPSDAFRILHVDKDLQLLAQSELLLSAHDDRLCVETTDDPTAALDALSESTFDAVISGSQLSGMDGLTLLTAVRDSNPEIPFVLFAAEDRITIDDEPPHPEVDRYLQQSDDLTTDFKLLAQTVLDVITARRRVDRLQSIEDNYTGLCANAPLAVIGWQPDGEICEWNTHAESLFGWSTASACGQQLETLLGLNIDYKQLLAGDIESLSSSSVDDIEQLSHSVDTVFSTTVDGTRVVCEWHSTPVLTADSPMVLSIVLDVTESYERKATLQEYVAAVEASDDSIYMLDPDGNYVFANTEHCARLAADDKIETATEEAVVGCSYESVHGPGDELFARLGRIIAAGEAETEEYAFQTEDVWSYRTYSPVFDPETDEPLGVVVISKDITDRKRAENRASFLHSLLRHDVTNKLHAAEGYLDLAFETAGQSTTHLETAARLLEECLGLLNEVSMLSSVTDTEIEPCDLQDVLSGVVESYRPQATSADIDLNFEACDGRVRGGPLLDALFGNLIGNAITHSNAESIEIACQSDGEWYHISIVDDGDGIDTEDAAEILEPGVSVGETGGSGLGLYLVSEITESYGGELSMSDTPGGGLSVTVRLQAVA